MSNRLFTWASAVVFGYHYNLPVRVHGWYRTQIGPWLRNEKNKRIYFNYFNKHNSVVQFKIREKIFSKRVLFNPVISENLNIDQIDTIIFNTIPHSDRYFNNLKEFRKIIIKELYEMIRNPIRRRIESAPTPDIGVHIRRGDFVNVGHVESIEYFAGVIAYLKSKFGPALQVTLFTDSREDEISDLLSLENVRLFKGKTDIEDLLVLSKSAFIVTSHLSSFSYWAAFLSDAVIIHNQNYTGSPVRNDEFVKEGGYLIEMRSTPIMQFQK